MKTRNKVILILAMGAVALPALANTVAAEATAITSVEIAGLDVPGAAGADYHGLRFELDGKVENGIVYSADLRAGDLEGAGAQMIDLEAGYHFANIIGPVLGYQYASIAGLELDRFVLGASADYDVTPEFAVTGKLVSDVDNFGDDYELALGVSYKVAAATRISAEYKHWETAGINTDGGNIGIQHDLSDTMFIDGKVLYSDTRSVEVTGASIGMGFRF